VTLDQPPLHFDLFSHVVRNLLPKTTANHRKPPQTTANEEPAIDKSGPIAVYCARYGRSDCKTSEIDIRGR
jgi:hypothetical protein